MEQQIQYILYIIYFIYTLQIKNELDDEESPEYLTLMIFLVS